MERLRIVADFSRISGESFRKSSVTARMVNAASIAQGRRAPSRLSQPFGEIEHGVAGRRGGYPRVSTEPAINPAATGQAGKYLSAGVLDVADGESETVRSVERPSRIGWQGLCALRSSRVDDIILTTTQECRRASQHS